MIGAELDFDARYAVAVCVGDSAKSCELRCSGVLIAPNVVLTARHCATTKLESGVDCQRDTARGVELAADRAWVTNATVIEGSTFSRGLSWAVARSAAACGHDIALLTLDSPIRSDAARFASPDFDQVAFDREVTLVGYGARARTDERAGMRGSRAHVPVVCSGATGVCRAYPTQLAGSEFLVSVHACPGDSGGGAFVGDGTSVVGIASRNLAAEGRCGEAIFSTLGQHALLMARTVRIASELSPYELPAWVTRAEARGNAVDRAPKSFGAPCDEDDDCDSHACRSKDSEHWVCSQPCSWGCPRGASCNDANQSCFLDEPAREPSGCAVTNGSLVPDVAPPSIAALLAVLLTRAIRRRIRR